MEPSRNAAFPGLGEMARLLIICQGRSAEVDGYRQARTENCLAETDQPLKSLPSGRNVCAKFAASGNLGPNSDFRIRTRLGRKPAARAGTGKTDRPGWRIRGSKIGKSPNFRGFQRDHCCAACPDSCRIVPFDDVPSVTVFGTFRQETSKTASLASP